MKEIDPIFCEIVNNNFFHMICRPTFKITQGLNILTVTIRNYGVYSIMKQKAFEGGRSRALIRMNFHL